jgi:hypothetical protein
MEWISTMVMKLETKNGGEGGNQEQIVSPTWHAKCQSGFTTLPPVLLQEQCTMILLLERDLVS